MWERIIDAMALLAVAGLWGGMAFFAAVYAPLVFIRLQAAVAGRFIRQVFPAYYLAMGAASAVAAAALALGTTHGGWSAAVMALVGAGFWIARQVLMPVINRSRDAGLAGDATADRRFRRLHRASVMVNAAQRVAVLAVLVPFAWVHS